MKRHSGQGREGMKAYQQEKPPSLVDELKLKANYKMWKKKKITAVRMRKEVPPADNCAVVVCLPDNAIPHDRLMTMLETDNGLKLKSLQFDPVSVHSIDAEAKSQWILRFEDVATCNRLIISGININGENLSVRRFNDVMKGEHDAYTFYQIIKQMDAYKAKKPKKSRSTDTQTVMDVKRKV